MRRFFILVSLVATLAGCSASGASATSKPLAAHPTGQHQALAPLSIQAIAKKEALADNHARIEKVLARVRHQVGKTWYVYSGASPAGWDCSGLVYWAYEQLKFHVKHSANALAHTGRIVKTPKAGDIVTFGYRGSNSFFHAALYLGDGKIIHAGFYKGQRTTILKLTDPNLRGLQVRFTRLIDSN